ncbi:hypothetical protein CP8484711_0790B, partial [Chlamydia psittaci 84-8471/1]
SRRIAALAITIASYFPFSSCSSLSSIVPRISRIRPSGNSVFSVSPRRKEELPNLGTLGKRFHK